MANSNLVNEFYCHNTKARASMLFVHDRVSGICVLSLAYATNKKDAKTGKGDLYNKAQARAILKARVAGFLAEAAMRGNPPPQAYHPHTFFLGLYDGDRSKNDIFGPLVDAFQGMTARRNVNAENLYLHVYAQGLVTMANHKVGRKWREDRKKQEEANRAEMDAIIKRLKENLAASMPLMLTDKNLGAVNLQNCTV